MSDLARIHSTNDPGEAEVIKNALEAAGIDCFLEGEQQAGFTGIFEINLTVPASQADTARRIISEVSDHDPQ